MKTRKRKTQAVGAVTKTARTRPSLSAARPGSAPLPRILRWFLIVASVTGLVATAGRCAIAQRRAASLGASDLRNVDPDVAALVGQTRTDLATNRRDPLLWARLGMVCEANNLLGPAADAYRQALVLDPSNAQWHYRLAIVSAKTGDVALAVEHVEVTSKLQPDFAPAYWRKGLWLIDQGRLNDAAAAFKTAIAIDPSDPAGWLGLARALL